MQLRGALVSQNHVVQADEFRATAETVMKERGVDLAAVDVEGPVASECRTTRGDEQVWVFTFRPIRGHPSAPKWAFPLKVAVAKDGSWADVLR